MTDGWVVVPRWPEFQHYRDRGSRPPWIKAYTRLVHDDAYLELAPTARALLHGIWALYALHACELRASSVQGALKMRATREHWQSLIQAGFIEISASKPLAPRARSREVEKEKEPPLPPLGGNGASARKPPRLAGYTGCRRTRSVAAAGYTRDPLGTDTPPKDWPHPKPTRAQVIAALKQRERP